MKRICEGCRKPFQPEENDDSMECKKCTEMFENGFAEDHWEYMDEGCSCGDVGCANCDSNIRGFSLDY